MPKFFIKNEAIYDNYIEIIGEDINHIKNVLRKKVGDQLIICNADIKKDYLCEIAKFEEEAIKCNILKQLESNSESNIKISIWQGLPKADKMELIIQKAVELGAQDIVPIEMKRCVVKLTEKDKKKKLERWQKISEVAAKQSGRNQIPEIKTMASIENICNLIDEYDIVIVAYEKEKENTLKQELKKLSKKENLKIAVIIGPEGGIEETEVKKLKENGAKIVTLGNRILRTETVALAILSMILYEFSE